MRNDASLFRRAPLLALLSLAAACGLPRTAMAPSSAAAAPTNLDPRSPLTGVQRHWVDSTLASLSLRERVGQMVNVWVLGDYTNNRDSSFAEVLRWIRDDHIGGVSMSLGSPIEVAAKVNAMQRAARVPLTVAADLEPNLGRLQGGVFDHYLMEAGGATVFPNAMAIGATGRVQDAYDVGRAIAREGRASGIDVNFAPVVDVNNNPSNPVINTRSFGEDPKRVAELSAAFVKGTQDGGEAATIKHFPGHGDTDVDSHVGLPMVSASMARLDTVELVPFHAGIDAGASMVMTAHIALPAVQGDSTTPATLAPRIITGLLRDTLGFGGLAITDAMTMGGIGKGYTTEESSVLAVKAGADVLLKPSDPTAAVNAVVAAVERGEISRARIDSSVRRVLEVKARTGVAFQPEVSLERLRDVVHSPEHVALAADVARRAITLLRDRGQLIPVAPAGRAVLVQYMPPSELRAGRVLAAQLRSALPGMTEFDVSPATDAMTLDSIAAAARGAERVIIATHVRRIEGEGRFAIPAPIARFIDSLSQRERAVVVSFGNPYLVRQFPSVGTYMVTYGVADVLEGAAADALLGRAAVTGRVPVSLPGFFERGDGLQRAAGVRSQAAPSFSPTMDAPRSRMTTGARGTFEVTVTPQPGDGYADGTALGRMTIDKSFHGDLEGTSKGQMLTGMTNVKASAGYVAIERVTGTLAGRRGSFILQHSGTMSRGVPGLAITVVPDSGTEELAGLSGTMLIEVAGGRHSYTFEYSLPATP